MKVDVSYPGWDVPILRVWLAPKLTIAEPPREALVAEIANLKAENTALRRYRTDMFVLSLMSGVGFTGIIFLIGSLLP